MISLLFDVLQLALGLTLAIGGAISLVRPQTSAAGRRVTRFIENAWAGAGPSSHRNISLAALGLGLFITGGIAASWLLT